MLKLATGAAAWMLRDGGWSCWLFAAGVGTAVGWRWDSPHGGALGAAAGATAGLLLVKGLAALLPGGRARARQAQAARTPRRARYQRSEDAGGKYDARGWVVVDQDGEGFGGPGLAPARLYATWEEAAAAMDAVNVLLGGRPRPAETIDGHCAECARRWNAKA